MSFLSRSLLRPAHIWTGLDWTTARVRENGADWEGRLEEMSHRITGDLGLCQPRGEFPLVLLHHRHTWRWETWVEEGYSEIARSSVQCIVYSVEAAIPETQSRSCPLGCSSRSALASSSTSLTSSCRSGESCTAHYTLHSQQSTVHPEHCTLHCTLQPVYETDLPLHCPRARP